ncbi:MAG: hypothetical protein ACOC80_15105, partial [Petrotogales bacterium]
MAQQEPQQEHKEIFVKIIEDIKSRNSHLLGTVIFKKDENLFQIIIYNQHGRVEYVSALLRDVRISQTSHLGGRMINP